MTHIREKSNKNIIFIEHRVIGPTHQYTIMWIVPMISFGLFRDPPIALQVVPLSHFNMRSSQIHSTYNCPLCLSNDVASLEKWTKVGPIYDTARQTMEYVVSINSSLECSGNQYFMLPCPVKSIRWPISRKWKCEWR